MHIILEPDNKNSGIITAHDGEQISWRSNKWSHIKTQNVDEVFGLLTAYWESMGPKFQSKIFALYKRAAKILDDVTDFKTLNEELSKVCCTLLDAHNLKGIAEVIDRDKDIFFGDTLSETYGGQPEDQTYRIEDYFQLVLFSVAIKSLTPIWGMYTSTAKDDVGIEYEELKALDLIIDSRMMKSDPALKLEKYCNAQAEKKKINSCGSITRGLPPEDIPYYFYAMAIVRRIPTQKFRIDKLLITNIYHFLNDRGKDLAKGPNDRVAKDGGGDDQDRESVPEQFRITQAIPDYIPVSMKPFCLDLEKMTKAVFGDLAYLNEVIAAHKTINGHKYFSVSEFFYTFFDKALKDAIHTSMVIYMERDEVVACMAVTAVWLRVNNFQNLSEIILSERTDKSLNEMEHGGMPMNPLRKESIAKLNALFEYNYRTSKTAKSINPGVDYITNSTLIISQYRWSCDSECFRDIRNELAALILFPHN